MSRLADFVPTLRTDFLRRDVDGNSVVWSPLATEPTVLDPVAAVMLDVVDGEATVQQLAREVHEEVGVDLEVALDQVTRVVELFGHAGLLTASTTTTTAIEAIEQRELFVNPCSACMKNAVRGMTSLSLRFGDHIVGVACDSRRGTRKLRDALADHVVTDDHDAPVGFVITAPTGLQRSHQLSDRSGFVLSQGRGLDSGLRALAGHLTAFLPPAPGTVRVRARAVVEGNRIVVGLFPLLLMPRAQEVELAKLGYGLADRLALDIEVATGRIVNPAVPWPNLESLSAGPGHMSTEVSGHVASVLAAVPVGTPQPNRAEVVSMLASGALHGSPDDVLDAVTRLVAGAVLCSTVPDEGALMQALGEAHKEGGGSSGP